MSSNVLRAMSRPTPSLLIRSIQQRAQAIPPLLTRTYAGEASPQNTSNVSNPHASSIEGQQINQSRATDSIPQQDSASLANPVSNPSSMGIGQQEEQTQSQAEMKRDPKEADSKKREEVLKAGQNKKLDAADDGTGQVR